MRPRLIFALSLSVILIGSATWFRFTDAKKAVAANLIVVPNPSDQDGSLADNPDAENSQLADTGASTGNATSTTASTPLTDTDIISRQLFSDYVNLSANNQATDDNLNALGDEYASTIVGLDQAPSITMDEIQTIPDSKENAQSYGANLLLIYNKYNSRLITATNTNKDPNDFGPDTITYTKTLATIYQEEADELKGMLVPDMLVPDQVKLINYYLQKSWDMNAIANLDTNPTDGAAAIASEGNSTNDEQNIFSDIQELLASNGIILKNS